MLAKPNVNELMEKSGNRYETAVAIAKRARQIAEERIAIGSKLITDPVDVASKEIMDNEVKVKIDGKYFVEEEEKDIDSVISETVEGILKELQTPEEEPLEPEMMQKKKNPERKSKKIVKSESTSEELGEMPQENVEVNGEKEEVQVQKPKRTRKTKKTDGEE